MALWLQMSKITPNNRNRNFNTEGIWQPPLKSRNSKIRLHSVLSWPKIGIEPKFHEDVTSGGWDYRGQTDRQTTFLNYICRCLLQALYFHCPLSSLIRILAFSTGEINTLSFVDMRIWQQLCLKAVIGQNMLVKQCLCWVLPGPTTLWERGTVTFYRQWQWQLW